MYNLIIASATFSPSIAEVVIPPEYPAPSPQGYIPLMLDSKFSSLIILTGEEVLDSIPAKIVSSWLKQAIF